MEVRKGEELAVRFLMRKGYEIAERGWSCEEGAVDIIARDGNDLVFVEVKTRRGSALPYECGSEAKAARLKRSAVLYTAEHGLNEVEVRFDVMGVLLVGERAIVRHHVSVL